MNGRMRVAEVHDRVGARRHLLPHESGQTLEVHDESAHGRGRHDLWAGPGRAQASLLLLTPSVNPIEVGRAEHDQEIQLAEQELITPRELSVDVPAPIAGRILQALETVDGRRQLARRLRPSAHTPALENHHVAPTVPARPLRHGTALILGLVESRQRNGLALSQPTKDTYPQIHVVCPGHAAGGEQGMNRLRALKALRSREIEIVEREDRSTHSVQAFQQSLKQPRQGRFAGALRAVDPEHQGGSVDVLCDPCRHRHVEFGDQGVRRPHDAFSGAPGFDLGPNIGKLVAKAATRSNRPKHEPIISPIPAPARPGATVLRDWVSGGPLATGVLARGRSVAGADAVPDVHLRTMRAPKIRILVAKPGLDGHDRGAKVVARALRDAGFEVVYTGLHQTPDMIAVAAIQEDVDAVGLSIMSGAHNTLFPAVLDALSSRGAKDIVVFGGGIVPEADAESLRARGVGAIFTPGAALDEIVDWIHINVKPRSLEA